MKTTGVIRRIDELGRIVIPKEIRKNLRIKNELSQDNLTNFLEVTQACIVRYEKGLVCISTSKLSKEFKVSISYLCWKEN